MAWTALLPYGSELLMGLLATLVLTVAATVTSFFAAILLALATQLGNKWLRNAVAVYTQVVLGTPVLVLMYIIYFVLPKFGLRLDEITAGLLTLTMYYSPYMAEAIRGAVAAIPAGQIDAGHTAGLYGVKLLRRIVAPQAMGLAIPPLTGLTIGLAKDTAVLSVISVHELAYATKQVVSITYAPFEAWCVVALAYWLVLSGFELAMRRVEGSATRYRIT